MVIRVKTSFCGAVTASRGQVLDLPEEQAKDLIQAGYAVSIAETKPTETEAPKDAEAQEDPKPKRSRKK